MWTHRFKRVILLESCEYLSKRYLGRRVAVKIRSLEQYRSVVGTVWAQSRIPILRELGIARTNVGLDLARAGCATVYRQAGAQYGGLKRQYERAEALLRRNEKECGERRRTSHLPSLSGLCELQRRHRMG